MIPPARISENLDDPVRRDFGAMLQATAGAPAGGRVAKGCHSCWAVACASWTADAQAEAAGW